VLRPRREARRQSLARLVIGMTGAMSVLAITGSCRRGSGTPVADLSAAVLRVGVARLSPTSPVDGLRQLAQNYSVESLVRLAEDGRIEPLLASAWTVTGDGRSVVFQLRQGVKFHDGSSFTSDSVAKALPEALKGFMGTAVGDIEEIKVSGNSAIQARFRQASPFLLEAFEAPIRKAGKGVTGTGPFMVPADSPSELRANSDYYLGRPIIQQITFTNYPSVRTAWAEMLRGSVDMLYDVDSDGLTSLEGSSAVEIFKYVRHYQYAIAFNSQAPGLRAKEIRRALNFAIDRPGLVQGALGGNGLPSTTPVPPQHWAFRRDLPTFRLDPQRAAATLKKGFHFSCLIPPEAVNERLALELKRQLAEVGVDMSVEEVAQDQLRDRMKGRQFEAALIEAISGPTLFRPYLLWHSEGPLNPGGLGNRTIDVAFDRLRVASSEDEYRQAVGGLQQAFEDDPPAIFLAWAERARAVSKRFVVPPPESGRDILGTLRLWKPAGDAKQASLH
jgi:peptide/nickel transport system substrate-binding protein